MPARFLSNSFLRKYFRRKYLCSSRLIEEKAGRKPNRKLNVFSNKLKGRFNKPRFLPVIPPVYKSTALNTDACCLSSALKNAFAKAMQLTAAAGFKVFIE